MKKLILIVAALIGSYFITFAGPGPAPDNTANQPKQWLFKPLSTNDVSLELERLGGNVQMYLFSQNMKNVDLIFVEKSKDPTGGFTRCKTVKVSEHLVKSKNYITVVDDTPYDSASDCYYRIKTVSSTGTTKVYPVVGLSPIIAIEPETVDNR
jgi:hypothetical protein